MAKQGICHTCGQFAEKIAEAEAVGKDEEIVEAWKNSLALHMGLEHGARTAVVLQERSG
ncbi:hypothetical protein AB0A05_26890 [Streptomyces sp. NPDC046374]|uniref:hypothetical protein n=1 Tax=Streptomyces sp. NPDC046374 TaxID=3154917 RepID=UPI0033E99C76